MIYLLDTNVISELIAKQPSQKVIDFVANLDEARVYLSVITIGEVQRGIMRLANGTRKQSLLAWLEDDLRTRFQDRILPLDTETLLVWGTFMAELEAKGRTLSSFDSLIAATALRHRMVLVTRNEKDFAGSGLVIVNPFEAR